MLKGALARRYAKALFEIGVQQDLNQVETDLQQLTGLIAENAEVAHLLYHPHISLTEKKAIMDKLFSGSMSDTVRHFFYLLIDKRRENLLPDIQREFMLLADQARNIVEARISSAAPLSKSQEERLHKELDRITGKNVRMVKEVRPELIGGVIVQIGDQVMDGTVAYKLSQIRLSLG
ncbi:F0F1 ATP synthase subunit delta [Desulfitobacterium sp.]|uniref:F0F1 ATP synthase subunit delta n=1 Tax=Desulfitobacterium sp. TaxID=49981 RepID=UPI002C66CCE2|nr:F0F1 ATP synthase subunit delta [Desulfitobacterium sp.]HVJ49219.1 F0F1 ATP synthase subunit delta [Desulfitobacterium sp.]